MTILQRLKQRIGEQAAPIRYVIDEGSIRYFADSIMDPDPRYTRESKRGCDMAGPLVGPPTFFGSATGLRDMPAGDPRTMSALDLPLPPGWPTLATGDEFDFYQPVCAGMTLVAIERLVDAYEKSGRTGRLIFYTIEKTFNTIGGAPVLRRLLRCAAREPLPPSQPAAVTTRRNRAPRPAALVSQVTGPITVRHLAMFATATAEFVDIHYDADFARSVGLPGPIIQGLYKTALIARLLKDWSGDVARIQRLDVRHHGMDLAGSHLTVSATVRETSGLLSSCEVSVRNQNDAITTSGTAQVLTGDTEEQQQE